jgi:hypothetical protein
VSAIVKLHYALTYVLLRHRLDLDRYCDSEHLVAYRVFPFIEIE